MASMETLFPSLSVSDCIFVYTLLPGVFAILLPYIINRTLHCNNLILITEMNKPVCSFVQPSWKSPAWDAAENFGWLNKDHNGEVPGIESMIKIMVSVV